MSARCAPISSLACSRVGAQCDHGATYAVACWIGGLLRARVVPAQAQDELIWSAHGRVELHGLSCVVDDWDAASWRPPPREGMREGGPKPR